MAIETDEIAVDQPALQAPPLPAGAARVRAGAATRLVVLAAAGGLVASSAIAFLGEYPGSYTADSFYQLGQALTRAYSDWHPPLMAAWWSVLIRATGTPSALLAWHQLMLLAALAVLGALVAARRAAPIALLLAAVPLCPVVVNFSGVMWKDVGCAFALAVAAAAAAWPRPGSRGGEALRLGAVLVFLGYAMNVRWNALPAVLPLLVLAWRNRAPATARPGRALLRAAAVAVPLTLAYAALPGFVNNRVLHASHERLSSSLHMMDVAGIAARTGEDLVPAFMRTGPGVDARQIADIYWISANWGSSMFLFFPYDGKPPPLRLPRTDAETDELARAWRDGIAHHPGAYLRHRWAFMAKLLRIGESTPYFHYIMPPEPADLELLLKGGPMELRMHEVLVRDHAARPPGAHLAHRVVRAIVRRIGDSRAFLGWPWLVLSLAIAASWPLLARRAPVTARAAALIALSGVLYAVSYFPIAPVADFRFLYWTVLATLLAGAAWLAAVVESLRRP